MFIPQKTIPLDHQAGIFLKLFKDFKKVGFTRNKNIIFEGYLQPLPLSKKYLVRIEYNYKCRPKITLPKEDFLHARPPHLFKDDSLCLYHRNGLGAWTSRDLISDLVPLIAHWLWCYDIWKVTGKTKWYGEEYPHDPVESKRPS